MAAKDKTETTARTEPHKNRLIKPLVLVLFLAVAGFGAYSFHAWRTAVAANPAAQQQQIIDYVSQAVLTPTEKPQVATVQDASKITNGALAHTTKDGDMLLVYAQADRVIVYRPSVHKVVNMLTIQNQASLPAAATQKTN